MLTKEIAETLAHLAHLVRDELSTRAGCPRWDERGILTSLRDVAGRPIEDVCLAVIRAASDQGAHTPGVIPSDGPHWRERISAGRAPRNPLPHEECGKHPGQFRLSCSGCHSDRLAATASETANRRGGVDTEALRLARAQVAIRPTGHCEHGRARKLCDQHDTPTEET